MESSESDPNFVPRPAPLTPEQAAAEDRLIRRMLLGGAAMVVLGVLFVAVVITVMISLNFNFLNWME